MRVILTGGGTGGHVYPALAVGECLRRRRPDAELLYVGTERGLERELAAEAGIAFSAVRARAVAGRNPLRQIWALVHNAAGVSDAWSVMFRLNPELVLATGGYVSVPVVVAAWLSRVPIVIHEQNVVPGAANRYLGRIATEICVSTDETADQFRRRPRVRVTGNPVRLAVLSAVRAESALRLGLDPRRPTVLVVGGSRGAETLALAVASLARMAVDSGGQLVAATGPGYYDRVCRDLEAEGIVPTVPGQIRIEPYLHQMPDALASADVVVARAGATTIAEVTARGLPAVLVPSPNVVGDHQTRNARALERAGAALVVTEVQARRGMLVEAVARALTPDLNREMAAASRRCGRPDAADRVVDRIVAIVDGEWRGQA